MSPGDLLHLLTVLTFVNITLSFNVDTSEPIVLQSGSSGEYFGFTVALHSHSADKWILVGAPLANQTAPPGSRYKIHERYGGVYKCRPQKNSACEAIPIDTRDPDYQEIDNKQIDIEEKVGQWLGGSLYSTGQNGKVVACAPRYSLRGISTGDPEKRLRRLLGRCFLLRDNLGGLQKQVDPCYHGSNTRELLYGYGQYGYCQAGFSVAIASDGSSLAFGTPGVSYGKGSIAAFFQDIGKTIFAARSDLKIDYWGDAMGYSITVGRFKSSGKEQLIGGAPRADDLKGRVMVFDVVGEEKIAVSFTLPLPSDLQVGSYFGQALCAVDLNNDGLSDLLVGAPRHSYDADEGRVYVYVNNGIGALNLMESMVLEGDKHRRAHFGFAIASAGDLNKDGFNDVVIGAPYGGPDDRGAVYIYYGSKDGIDTKYRQKITASATGQPSLRTFGYSLSGGLDVDDNSYPDIAVGAFSSDRAVLLRTRPIVEVTGKIELSTNQIILESNKTNMCELHGIQHKCLTAKVCLKYKFKVPVKQGLEVSYSLELDQDRQSHFLRRIFFDPQNSTDKVFSVTKKMHLTNEGVWHCERNIKIYLREKQEIGDLLTPLTFDLKYDLKKTSSCSVCPIMNDYDNVRRRTVRAEATFQKHCKNKVCVPDLMISGSVSFRGGYKDLRIGISKEMFVSINVGNKADDFAYPGRVIVTYPSFLGYIGSGVGQGVQCSRESIGDIEEKAVCVVGMPFKGKTTKKFDLTFSTVGVKGNISKFYIDLEATSPSTDADPIDNKDRLEVNVKFEADLSITGSTIPDEVVYENNAIASPSIKSETDIGPVVWQTIIVRNEGPSAVDGSVVTINIPWKQSKEEYSYLLYLLHVRVRGSAAICDVTTNPLNIKMSNSTQRPAVLESGSSSAAGKTRQRRTASKSNEMNCDVVNCLRFTCQLGRLQKGDGVEIQLTSRLWQNTLVKAGVGSIDLVTMASVTPPSSITQPPNDNNNEVKLPVRANPKVSAKRDEPTPVWIIVVSVLAGLLLLGLLVFALFRVGFFKRKRAKDMATEEEEMTQDSNRGKYETSGLQESS